MRCLSKAKPLVGMLHLYAADVACDIQILDNFALKVLRYVRGGLCASIESLLDGGETICHYGICPIHCRCK